MTFCNQVPRCRRYCLLPLAIWRYWIMMLVILSEFSNAQQWMKLALASSNIYNRELCNHYQSWTKSQRTLCLQYTELIPKVAEGAEMAYSECRHQYRWRRWNCSATKPVLTNKIWTYDLNEYASLFGKQFEPEGREASFVSSIFSAGVAYSITKACSSNKLDSCTCERSNSGYPVAKGFQWNQCSDNVQFGLSFAKRFIDSVDRNWSVGRSYTTHSQLLMNLHNNKVGRELLKENLQKNCVCHGVSGTCTTRVCSRSLAPFRDIAALLRKKSDTAIHTTLKYINTHRILMPINNQLTPVTNAHLIFLKGSPSYCHTVSGRRCKVKTRKKKAGKNDNNNNDGGGGRSKGSCDVMCCGHGYRTKLRTVAKHCKCQFIWCCRVTCEKCYQTQKIHTCK